MGRSQRSSTPKDHHNWRIEHNSYSDIRELVSLLKLKAVVPSPPISYVESNEAAEDSGMKEEEAESSAGEDPETSSGGTDQLVGYIVCFANAVELYQWKNQIVSDVVVMTIS